ncbi:MAG TPA: UTP--glucose-1-phosphate uridylyltransferase [Baekduia sp.]|uniref:UTP--glucose-1-phosphate uridylyltransferase n=1 Tax=Baekduia sp. TaxID=2600305 RepID=UPI002D777144|nr:UTP--glucose-1-phosphate uridylyltransferase [Baekduia sp.]HET6506722.1 UTP--glucose-1-phosphate uridylyltransferase [Baekduia sp.]
MSGLEAAVEKMRAEGLGDAAVESFARQYERLREGETGTLAESEIEPVASLPDADELTAEADAELLDATVVIKLNGGLGTSMGMTKAKSLLEVKDGRTFLDLIAEQVLALREASGARIPLILMSSFATREDSLAALDAYDDLSAGLPPDFVQNKVPKIRQDTLEPVAWEADPSLEWAPPGHGDLYTALVTSGMLEALLDAGYRYAFVSNSDNLGAVLDRRILAWLASSGAPFLMEVADRTSSDRKGGHLARRKSDGGLVLREIAQTPDADVDAFQNTSRHKYFNTNTLWIDLRALRDLLSGSGVIDLPMIVNKKTVDPGDTSSTPVIQLETAMGAAIGVFEGAAALRVPRSRFVPVKTTNDLLSLRSDAYVIGDGRAVHLAAERHGVPPFVDLDSDHYKLVADFDARFPSGAPSLVACDALHVVGDVTFGADVVVRGEVTVEGVERVEDGAVLEG